MDLILASASPRRAQILRNAGFSFEVHPANVDETPLASEPAGDYVRRLSEAKAQAVADTIATRGPARMFVIGADTVVFSNGVILGKPPDALQARRMLHNLSGAAHEVLTGLSVIRMPDRERASEVISTRVTFLPLSERDIEQYVATDEPFDKAGAYGIQGIAGRFASRIEGCYFNVMGLPVSALWRILCSMGWSGDIRA